MRYEIVDDGYDSFSKMDFSEILTEFETEQEKNAVDIFQEIFDVLNSSLNHRSTRIPITGEGYVIMIREIKLRLLKRHISGRLHLFRVEQNGKRTLVKD